MLPWWLVLRHHLLVVVLLWLSLISNMFKCASVYHVMMYQGQLTVLYWPADLTMSLFLPNLFQHVPL